MYRRKMGGYIVFECWGFKKVIMDGFFRTGFIGFWSLKAAIIFIPAILMLNYRLGSSICLAWKDLTALDILFLKLQISLQYRVRPRLQPHNPILPPYL